MFAVGLERAYTKHWPLTGSKKADITLKMCGEGGEGKAERGGVGLREGEMER